VTAEPDCDLHPHERSDALRPGDTFRLNDHPDFLLTIRAVFDDSNARGTVTVIGMGVIGTMRLTPRQVARCWRPINRSR
jgi:hypothetical protein